MEKANLPKNVFICQREFISHLHNKRLWMNINLDGFFFLYFADDYRIGYKRYARKCFM